MYLRVPRLLVCYLTRKYPTECCLIAATSVFRQRLSQLLPLPQTGTKPRIKPPQSIDTMCNCLYSASTSASSEIAQVEKEKLVVKVWKKKSCQVLSKLWESHIIPNSIGNHRPPSMDKQWCKEGRSGCLIKRNSEIAESIRHSLAQFPKTMVAPPRLSTGCLVMACIYFIYINVKCTTASRLHKELQFCTTSPDPERV